MYEHMLIQKMLNGTEHWCPVRGDGWISELSFNRDFTVYT